MVAAAGLAALVASLAWSRPPDGMPGPAAEALADEVDAAIGQEAWAATGAVRWTVFGHAWLWDRERNLVRYEDGRGVVLTEGWRPMGRAWRDGAQVGGDWKDARVREAYEGFVNDAFWAFGPTKLREDGTERLLVSERELLVRYGSGGVTPGDAYVWEIGPDGRPAAFRFWTRVLPVKGIRVAWGEWTELPTGAWVALRRGGRPFGFRLDDVDATAHLSDWYPDDDPFRPMFEPM